MGKMSDLPEYKTWENMKARCFNPNATGYSNYGGRGITVCPRWASSFALFLDDMGPKPGPNFSIERIDNGKNYEKSNCRWATRFEQANNRRTNALISHGGLTNTLERWAQIKNLSNKALWHRLNTLNWSVEKSLETPPKQETVLAITYLGVTKSVSGWAKDLGLPVSTLWNRLFRGWAVSRALSTARRAK